MPAEERKARADGVDELTAEAGAGDQSPAPPSDPSPEAQDPRDPPADDGRPVDEASAVEEDLDELVAKARERDEYLSLAQRTQADFENFRKRAARDISAAEARGVTKLARELLPALDNLQLALAAAQGDGESEAGPDSEQLIGGIRLVQRDLLAALGRLGIEPYSPEGERFDPAQHEAMAQHAVEGADSGTVVEVYQQGYRANGTILRPARVVVAE